MGCLDQESTAYDPPIISASTESDRNPDGREVRRLRLAAPLRRHRAEVEVSARVAEDRVAVARDEEEMVWLEAEDENMD